MDVTRGSRAAISRWRHAMRCLRSTRIANTSQPVGQWLHGHRRKQPL